MKHYKASVNKAVANIETLIMSLMKVNFDLKNSCQDCPDESDCDGEGKKRRRRKNKKTSVTKGKPGRGPKAEKATEPTRSPMRRVVGQSN